MLIEDINEGEGKKYPRLGRGHRIRTQFTTDYVPSWNNKSYSKRFNMAHIEITGTSYPNENELLQGYKVVSRYKANQGVINVNFSENAETPPGMAED